MRRLLGPIRRVLRRKELPEAEQLLRLAEEAKQAAKRPRPIGWTSWPPVFGGASRTAASLRPPSASR